VIQATLDWLRIQVTPAGLAAGTIQAAEAKQLAERQQLSDDGGLDPDTLAELARTGWMRQDVQLRGAYASTSGLRDRLDHPELVMLNLPSGAVAWACATLNCMASYVDDSGARLRPGDLFAAAGLFVDEPFTFVELSPKAAASIGFTTELQFLVVIPLP
jgi:hypothetical protein